MTPAVERGICSQPDCNEPAVGNAWDTTRDDRPNPYCLKHLELAKKLGYPIKSFSDTAHDTLDYDPLDYIDDEPDWQDEEWYESECEDEGCFV